MRSTQRLRSATRKKKKKKQKKKKKKKQKKKKKKKKKQEGGEKRGVVSAAERKRRVRLRHSDVGREKKGWIRPTWRNKKGKKVRHAMRELQGVEPLLSTGGGEDSVNVMIPSKVLAR